MTSHGHTVVMCTHLLAEAEGLADHVVVMEGGTDLVAGTPAELTQRFWPQPIVTFDAEDPRLLDRVASFPGVGGYRRDPSGVRIELDDLRRLPDMVASLVADGVRLTRVEPHEPTLEDLYFTIRRQAGVVGAVVTDPDPDDVGLVSGRRDRPGQPLAPITTGHGEMSPLGNGDRSPVGDGSPLGDGSTPWNAPNPGVAGTPATDEGVAR